MFSLTSDDPMLSVIVQKPGLPKINVSKKSFLQSENDPWTPRDFFNLIKDIQDPELPQSLGELEVVTEDRITLDADNTVRIDFTPTVPHCSMATFIGLAIRVKLLHCLPHKFKVRVGVTEGSHDSAESITKQLADKERVAAAIENTALTESIFALY
ncbi:hypothetical protein RCL1_003548 [Eukaryota sp. TZLM3-RCL]